MARVALIEAKPSRTDFIGHFDNQFEFDRYSLASDGTIKKVLKKSLLLLMQYRQRCRYRDRFRQL